MVARHARWSQLAIEVHLLVLTVASWQLGGTHGKPVYALWAVISGVSLFVLTGLVHEASHRHLCRSSWVNELAGNLAGWPVLTPLSAYRAFHLKHHQTTNGEGDPNAPLNSRWMLAVGSLVYTALIHHYALRNLRGRLRYRYLLETAGMTAFVAALALLLPRALRERAFFLPIGIVALLQNIRIVTEHLDLGTDRYRDTWQLVLPGWLSRWLLHYDHHLEHHLRPGLRWHELPAYREQLVARGTELALLRVTLIRYFRDVYLRPVRAATRPSPPRDLPRGAESDAGRMPSSHGARFRIDAALATNHPGSSARRYHGLDALRGVTMLLVVVLHAGLAYIVTPIPNLIWNVRDPAAYRAFDILCWWTLGISSPFYLMSGFFAAELSEARGLRAFLVNRSKRILGPLFVAGFTILPATFFIWVGGWLVSGQCTAREVLRMKFHSRGYQHNLYGPAHLWSLEYLALMLAGYAAWLAVGRKFPRRLPWQGRALNWLRLALASRWKPLLLAVPTTLILWAGHRHVGLDAIMDRSNSFVPEPFRLFHNLIFFAAGVSLHLFRNDLSRFASLGGTYLALSVPVFVCRAFLIQQDLLRPLSNLAALALAASGAVFTWLITFGLLGLALGRFNRPHRLLSYLADSSYWVYLVHLPIIGLLQADLYLVAVPAVVKFAIVLSVTFALCLASYQVAVRHTLLGHWLHGRRERPRPSFRFAPHPPAHRLNRNPAK
jgi:peptidoglycan/LPS O-acetylase OafA/YrhL